MTIDIRPIVDAEFPAWSDAVAVGFHHAQTRDGGAFRRPVWEAEIGRGRVLGGIDGGRVAGTLGAFHTELTVPGGSVGAGAITSVTVQATHRRRGILRAMMTRALRQAAELGEAVVVLIPSEWPIYGRYGFGPATEEVEWQIDTAAAGLLEPLPGTIELLGVEEWRQEMAEVYERLRSAMPGAISRAGWWWDRAAGLARPAGQPDDKSKLFAVHRDESGIAQGYATYTVEERDRVGLAPNNKLKADVFAATPAVRARLMQFLWEQDWVVEVEVGAQPTDDIWRLFLHNPRAAWQADRYDTLWVRIMDVPSALTARTYAGEGRLVLAVQDKDGYAEGVFAVEGGPEGATCVPTTQSPDLTLPVQTLGSLYLGGYAASSLARAGLVTEERPGALALADAMFRTAVAPFAPTWF